MAENDNNYTPEQQLVRVAATIDQPDKFAKVFCEAAESQKGIDLILKKNIKEVIKTDKETYDFLKKIVREVDKEDWRHFIKKVGTSGWAIILLVLGALLQAIFRHYLP